MTADTQVTASPVTPVRVLRDAAAYLDRHGWIQGSYYDQTATVFTPAACLVGAISMVCYGGPVEAPAQHFDDPGWAAFEATVAYLDLYLYLRFGHVPSEPSASVPMNVYDFNDVPGRIGEDVVQVLNEAADHLDRLHSGGEP